MSKEVKATYEYCSNGGIHEGQHKNLVCLEGGCQHKLMCAICQFEQHTEHSYTMARRYLNESMQGITKFADDLNFDTLKVLIDENKEQTAKLIEQVKVSFLESIDNINKYIDNQYEDIRTNLQLVSQLRLADLYVINERIVKSIHETSKFIKVKLEEQLKGAQDVVKKNSEEMEGQIKKWTNKMTNKKVYNWIRHFGIVCDDTKAKSLGPAAFRLAIVDEPLGSQKKIMAFTIAQLTQNWLGVGLVHKNSAQQKSFNFSYATVGHGCYMVGSNGLVWSNKQSDINNTVKSFNFLKNDTILVVYDPQTKKAIFKKEGSKNPKDQYEMDLTINPVNDLCFGVAFYYEGDQVEIRSLTALP